MLESSDIPAHPALGHPLKEAARCLWISLWLSEADLDAPPVQLVAVQLHGSAERERT